MKLSRERTRAVVDGLWEESILPALADYIRIPNESPFFDPEWEAHGHMDRAVELSRAWVAEHLGDEATIEVWKIEGRTPLLFVEVPGRGAGTVLLYGHLDKQPPMHGWEEDLGPWKPVFREGKLYGRGGADDGYAVFASAAATLALRDQGHHHPRLVFLIECSEESGSTDLVAYIEAYEERIGVPNLVICLDSGCGDYERLWLTTSLRGNVVGKLRVEILREGVHSGRASGVAASSFRIARRLLDRIEDVDTGHLSGPILNVPIPEERVAQARVAAEVIGPVVAGEMPWVEGAGPICEDPVELLLNRTWRPALSITGVDGVPSVASGGNVLRPFTELKLSLRLPPTADPLAAARYLGETLTSDPPYGAKVSFELDTPNAGWNAPPISEWLAESIDRGSRLFFGEEMGAIYYGEGGTIPFMGMLGERFPEAQFVITGVLGPASNAHGPNEFLHIETGKRLTAAIAHVLADFYEVHGDA